MNKRIKAQWVKALLSGKYLQAKGAQRRKDDKGRYGFCALGVLTDLYIKSKAGRAVNACWWEPGEPRASSTNPLNSTGLLDLEVASWAGLWGYCPYAGEKSLVYWNDETGVGFKSIAAQIQKYL